LYSFAVAIHTTVNSDNYLRVTNTNISINRWYSYIWSSSLY